MRARTAFWSAWSLWLLSVRTTMTVLVYNAIRPLPRSAANTGGAANVLAGTVFVVAFATVGALLVWKLPSNPIGWLLSAAGLCYATGISTVLLEHFAGTQQISHWLGFIWFLGIGLTLTFVLLLFPTGALPSRRWRPVAWVAAAGLAGWVLGSAFAPGRMGDGTSINPVGIGGAAGTVFRVLRGGLGLVLVAGAAAIASLVVRYRRAPSAEREQLKWLVYAAALVAMALLPQSLIPSNVASNPRATNIENAIGSAVFALVPIAIGIAVLKYRLYDIDVVINKTVVFGALAAFITAVYVGIVVGIGAAIGQGSKPNLGLSILATAVVALAFQPVRERVQRFANRLVYGDRATPYEVLSEFSSRMAGAYGGEDLLPRMARILAEGTGARDAVVWLKVGVELRPEAAWPMNGVPTENLALIGDGLPDLDATLTLGVHHHGELLGALSLTKPTGERLTPAEEHLARDLASAAGLVLRNVRLTEELLARLEDLKASRQRIVAAQDAERRRLERNIHDGAQQQLVALAVRIRLARTTNERDPTQAAGVLSQVGADLGQALDDLRDLARGIYPPLLADRGLGAALEAQARRAAVPVEIRSEGVGRYPQELEAAVYFCCLEALQNVAKYAQADRVSVQLAEHNRSLEFTVLDDGVGFDPGARGYGTGMQGMADRLAALGGELRVDSEPGRGTTVLGRLPVTAPSEGAIIGD